MMLKDSKFKGNSSIKQLERLANEALDENSSDYKKEYLELIEIIKQGIEVDIREE